MRFLLVLQGLLKREEGLRGGAIRFQTSCDSCCLCFLVETERGSERGSNTLPHLMLLLLVDDLLRGEEGVRGGATYRLASYRRRRYQKGIRHP